jgi:O-antigen/teichoic acid export membrane protein
MPGSAGGPNHQAAPTLPTPEGEAQAARATPAQERGLLARVLRNSVSLTAGRVGAAAARLAVAAIVVRMAGATTFAEYALVLGILAVAEWLLDFGTTEIAVREVCKPGAAAAPWLRGVARSKLLLAPLALFVFIATLLALRYPAHVQQAGWVTALTLLPMAGVSVFRVVFKAQLHMGREMAAELLSVLLMIPFIVLSLRAGGGLMALMLCHAGSRLAFLALCVIFARGLGAFPRATELPVGHQPVRGLLREAAPIGLIGLLVAVYEAMDVLFLSKLGQPLELAWYSGAQRIVWPALMVLTAVGGSLYPVLARRWPDTEGRFATDTQAALESVMLLAGFSAAIAFAGAEFLLGLLGPQLVDGAAVMRVLAVLVFFKAVAATLGPVLYIVGAQTGALKFIARALVVKALAIWLLVSQVGYLGVAVAAVLVELLFAALPTVRLLQARSPWRLAWARPLRIAAVTALSAALALAVGGGGVVSVLLAPLLFVPLAWVGGAVDRVRLAALVAAARS